MGKPLLVKKRNGDIASFVAEKLQNSLSVVLGDGNKKVIAQILKSVDTTFQGVVPTTKQIRDVVDKLLAKYPKARKAYADYHRNRKIEFKAYAGVRNDLNLSPAVMDELIDHFLQRNDQGRIIETPMRMYQRVAKYLASIERTYKQSPRKAEQDFYQVMVKGEFLPNTQILRTAGSVNQFFQMVALAVSDSLQGIMSAAQLMVGFQEQGTRVAMDLRALRPAGSPIKGQSAQAKGPAAFAHLFDVMSETLGSADHALNIPVTHPDHHAVCAQTYRNFDRVVSVPDEFLQAAVRKQDAQHINPKTRKVTKVNAEAELQALLDHAQKGLTLQFTPDIVIDNEQLLVHQGVVSGSLNLEAFVRKEKLELSRLRRAVRLAVHMLDNAIDGHNYQNVDVEAATKQHRRLSIGVCGYAEMLAALRIPYASTKALKVADDIMQLIAEEARKGSNELAKQRGSFPANKGKTTRNEHLVAVTDTGTSGITQSTQGIEPFEYAVRRNVDEQVYVCIHPMLEKLLRAYGVYDLASLLRTKNPSLPKKVAALFVTAADELASLKVQAAFEKHADAGVHKLIPAGKTLKDMQKLLAQARKLDLSSIHVVAKA